MSEKKKQHYISQFLLKNFSQPDNSKLINIYNRKNQKIIEGTPFKNQAQEAFFYGKDLTFEDFLGNTETKASKEIKKIFVDKTLPDYRDIRYSRLLHFIMLYAFRTKASVEHTEEKINSAFKEIFKHLEKYKDINLNEGRIKHPEPAAFNLASYMDNWVVTYDLNSVLLINETQREFISSDNPFVQYNLLMNRRERYELAGGLINKGLVIFFPLSPKFCFMMYDSFTYQTTENERKIFISKVTDIENVNLLQSISADQNLYFSRFTDKDYVIDLAQQGLGCKVDKHINKVINHPLESTKRLFFTTYIEHKEILDLSFLLEKDIETDYDILSAPRNREIEDWVKIDKKKLHTTFRI